MALPFWRFMAFVLVRNPRAIEFVLMNVMMYLHVGRFSNFVVKETNRRIGQIDAGLDPTAPRQSDADLARTALLTAAE